MEIADNIIKAYLRNALFITGTAYAGKSTMCKMLAEKHGLIWCGENFELDKFIGIADPNIQPNLCYTRTMRDWQEFVSRTPEQYAAWLENSSAEIAGFEVAELIGLCRQGRVIVDTNIPVELLRRIADYNQVAVMLSPQAMSVNRFFERDDPEKRFIMEQIMKCSDPEATLAGFRRSIALVNSPENYRRYAESGYFTLTRHEGDADTRPETLAALERHFGLPQGASPARLSF